MQETFITSADFVKAATDISDNIAGKYLLPAIREAQEIYLRPIIGGRLLDALKDVVASGGTFSGVRLDLVNLCQYYIAYAAIGLVIPRVSFKITNFGLTKTVDEKTEAASYGDVDRAIFFYQDKADYYCKRIQTLILANRGDFPEVDGCQCGEIRAQLYSAATCGVFLGGPRGKKIGGPGR